MKARANPFAVDRLDRLQYRFPDGSWGTLFDRLRQVGFRAAIVGPHGSGKTTLLGELGDHLEAAGQVVHRLQLNESRPAFEPETIAEFWRELQPDDVILFDGWERLPRLSAWRFRRRSRRAGGLIVTTHRSGALPTLVECHTSRQLLFDLLNELLGQRAVSVREEAARLFEQHGGNLRNVWRELYDQCADDILDFA